MTTLAPLLAATGLLVAFFGIPAVRAGRMSARAEPYLSGLQSKRSRLLVSPVTSRWRTAEHWLERRTSRLGMSGDRYLGERLRAAGETMGPAAYRLDQVVWAVTSMVGSWALMTAGASAGFDVDVRALPFLTVIAFAAGFLARDWWLGKQVAARRARLQEELPTAIDLITLSIMAGESVPAALARFRHPRVWDRRRVPSGGGGHQGRGPHGRVARGTKAQSAGARNCALRRCPCYRH